MGSGVHRGSRWLQPSTGGVEQGDGQLLPVPPHCGNTQVRYIVAVKHNPTNQNVVFGDVCVARLGFANHSEFKAAQVRALAAQGNARMAIYAARERFLSLEENAEFAAIISNQAEMTAPCHARNAFVSDIVSKFNKYGKLSAAQVSAFVRSIQRDREFEARRAAQAAEAPAGPVPTGARIEFEGELISTKVVETPYGCTTKMLVKLGNGSKVWLSAPAALDMATFKRGSRLKLRASVTASHDDATFGFGQRPHLISAALPVA